MLKRNERQYRKYLRTKSKWKAFDNRNSDDEKAKFSKQMSSNQLAQPKSIIASSSSSNDIDDNDDDDLDDLLEQRQRGYKRYLQMKSKSQNAKDESFSLEEENEEADDLPLSSRRRRWRRDPHRHNHPPSVLEATTRMASNPTTTTTMMARAILEY